MPIRKDLLEYRVDLTKQLKKIKDPDDRLRASKIAGEEALKRIKEMVAKQTSPVTGKSFEALSTKYKKYKKQFVGNTKANMQLTGDMLGELDLDYDEDSFTIFIDDPDEAIKAFNHNTGDTVPQRPFIPDDGKNQKFHKKSVRDKYESKIKKFANNLPKKPEGQKSVGKISLDDFVQTVATDKFIKSFTEDDVSTQDIPTRIDLDDFL